MKTLDDEQIDRIFERLEEITVQLDPDPIRRGPKYLNKKVAEIRNYMNEVQRFRRVVLQEKRKLNAVLNRKEAQYELKFNDLMANDERVTSKSSKSDREAKADDILRDLKSEIMDLQSELDDAKHVEEVVDSKRRELKDLNRDIRLQKRLIEDEIDTGAMWGEDNIDGGSGDEIETEDVDIADLLEDPMGEEDADPEEDSLEEDFGEEHDPDEVEESLEEMEIDSSSPDVDDLEPDNDEPETTEEDVEDLLADL